MDSGYDIKSIIRGFFSGAIHNDLLFPFPIISDDERLNLTILTDNLRTFFQEINYGDIDRNGIIPEAIYRGLADIGIFAIGMPEEYDGYGFSTQSYLKVIELLATVSPSVSAAIGSAYSIGVNAIHTFGTEAQKQQMLPAFACGEGLLAFACSEENSGSDIHAMETRATLSSDNDYYIINGCKKYVTNAGIASHFVVLTKTNVDVRGRLKDQISAFLVPRDLEGVSVGKQWEKLGMRGLDVRELVLENIRIPRDTILGQPGQGFTIAVSTLNECRLAQATACLGRMKVILDRALFDAQQRKQFGKAIIDCDTIRQMLAEMAINQFAAESMVYLIAGLLPRNDLDLSAEIASCKIFCSQALFKAANNSLQIAGGRGYLRDEPYEKELRDARMHQIVYGTNEVLLAYIALSGLAMPCTLLRGLNELLDHPLDDPAETLKGLYTYVSQRVTRLVPVDVLPEQGKNLYSRYIGPVEMFKIHPRLTDRTPVLERLIREFSGLIENLVIRHGDSVGQDEFMLNRMGSIAIDLFACASILSRLQSLVTIRGRKETRIEHSLATLFLENAIQRIGGNLQEFSSNQDDLNREIVTSLGLQGKYPSDITDMITMK